MDNLRKIICQLSAKDFTQIKSALLKNDSKKFLHVLVSYRRNNSTDEEIMKDVNCTKGSFYVLKSRLLDKVQELLVKNVEVQEVTDLQDSNALMQYVYEYPREMGIAILHQLEKKSTINDIPQELISVYSALKKVYFHSDKYYHYSQLYNKQIAYAIALEKSEDLLLNFNKTLANYYLSRSEEDKVLIYHFIKEIKNIYSLNKSHRFELIKNFILIQSQLFVNTDQQDEEPLEDLLKRCEQITKTYSNDKQIRYYKLVVDFLWFEYYYKLNQLKKAEQYLKIIDANEKIWLLLSNYCMAFKFLLSKAELFFKFEKTDEAGKEAYLDNYDFYTIVVLKFSKAIDQLNSGNIKESSDILFELTCDLSLHHFFHFEIEIKLTLAYLYIKQNKFDKADELMTSISRKINDGKKSKYLNGLLFIKVLNLLMGKSKKGISQAKLNDAIQQFDAYNTSERKILGFLKEEIETITA